MADETNLSGVVILVVALVVLVPLIGMGVMMLMFGLWGGGHMWNGGMWNGGMWNGTGAQWLWLVSWLVVLALLVGGGYLLYRAVNRSDGKRVDPALEELRLAYARGELSDEEFERRRERLERETREE